MISLTRLDQQQIVLNADEIAWITSRPDTPVRLATGENLVIRESVEDVVERIITFRARVMRSACMPIAGG